MEKSTCESFIERRLTLTQMSTECGKSPSTIGYWLRKHGLTMSTWRRPKGYKNMPDFDPHNPRETYRCWKCSEYKSPDGFYWKKSGKSSACKSCIAVLDTKRSKDFKQECVAYKGGECLSCGYSRCLAALEFHHIDPSEKDYTISTVRKGPLSKVMAELDKCVLVCSTCHREIHEGLKVVEMNPVRVVDVSDGDHHCPLSQDTGQ